MGNRVSWAICALLSVAVGRTAVAGGVSLPGVANPERGWRFESLVGLEPGDPAWRGTNNWPFARYRRDGVTVTQAYCYLTRYCESEIPEGKLAALQTDFDRARAEGVKFLLRFAYEQDTTRLRGPYLPQILAHVAQLKGIVNRNADVLYCLQIGWVGAWGEFHSSMSGIEDSPEQVAQVVAATLDILPPNRSTMMRYMPAREQALRQLGGRGGDRIGFFNDGTLAGFIEGGTFVDYPDKMEKQFWGALLWGKYGEKGNRFYDTVSRVGLRAPVDGELFWTTSRVNPCWETGLAAILRFREHHYTTFSVVHGNSDLDKSPAPGAIDRWRATPVTPELLAAYGVDCDPAYFAGAPYRTAYDFIRDHLGYRLVAKAVARTDGEARVTLHNYGFAAPVNPRPAYFAVMSADGRVRTFPTAFDCRALAAGADTEIVGRVPAGGAGDRLALWLPDEMLKTRPEYAIRLAGGAEVVERDGMVLNLIGGDRQREGDR